MDQLSGRYPNTELHVLQKSHRDVQIPDPDIVWRLRNLVPCSGVTPVVDFIMACLSNGLWRRVVS